MSTQGMRCIVVGLAPFRPDVSSGSAPTESAKTVVVTVEHEDGKPMHVAEILRKVLEETYAAEWLLKILNRNAMVAASARAKKTCRVNLNYGFGKETVVMIHRKNPADENQAHTERIHVSLVGNDNSSLAPSGTLSKFASVVQEEREGGAPTFCASISVNTSMWMAGEEGRTIELWESDTMHGVAERMVSSTMAGSSSSTAAPAAAAAPAAEAEAESGDEEVAATSSRTRRGATQKKSASKKGSKPSTTTKGGAEKKKLADKEDKDEAPKKKRKKSEDTAAEKKKKKSGGAASTAAKGKTSSSSAKSTGESAGAGAHNHVTLEDIDLSKPWSSLTMEIRERAQLDDWDENEYNSFSEPLRKTIVEKALDALRGGKSEDKVSDGSDGDDDDDEDGGSDNGKKKRSKSSAKTTATKGKGRGSEAASKKGSSKAKASKAAAKDSDEDADRGDGSKASRKGAKLSRDEEEALEEPPEGFTFPLKVLKKFKDDTTQKEKWEIYLDYKKKNREAVARSKSKKKAREEDKSAAVSSDTEKKSKKKRKKSDKDVDNEGAAEQSDDDDDDDNEGAAKKSLKKAKKASHKKKGGKK